MTPILADAGVPMLFWQFPAMLMALLPIIAVESIIARIVLRMPLGKLAGGVAVANAVSTLVGVPIAWLIMLLVNFAATGGSAHGFATPMDWFRSVVLQASWLVPYDEAFYWLIPAATLVLLIPYFLISVLVERLVLIRVWKTERRGSVTAASWLSNGISYAILALLVGSWLWRGLKAHGNI